MRRQAIDGGGWIDLDTATKYVESKDWNGRNWISCATGSQWDHESLYCSRRGVYVLNRWSQYQGSLPTWTRLDANEAAEWLVANSRDSDDAALQAAIAEAEV